MGDQTKVLMEKDEKKMSPGSKKWILVMDEDAAMRTETRRMLEKSGYSVYSAGSIEDAVECYKVARVCGYPFFLLRSKIHHTKGRRSHRIAPRPEENHHEVSLYNRKVQIILHRA